MRELALHVLDLMENSVRAGATLIKVSLVADTAQNQLRMLIEDNGSGLNVSPEEALNPFYTTKQGKRTGLGLSLFKAGAEAAGGTLELFPSELGGLAVRVRMELNHIDRSPLGDLADTISAMVCMEPEVEIWCELRVDERMAELHTHQAVKQFTDDGLNTFHCIQKINDLVKSMQVEMPEIW